MHDWWDEQPKRLLAAFLVIDLAFIVLHIVTDGGRGPITSLDTDIGLGGLWGFGKALAAAWMVHRAFRSTQITVYLAWAVTFVTVALDDLAEIHENLGDGLATAADLPAVAGLRPADLGELLVWAMLGIPLLIAIGLTVRHADARGRLDSLRFFTLMAVLVVVAAGLDALHMMATDDTGDPWAVTPLGVLEDGGELVVLSLLLTSAVAALRWRSADPIAGESVHLKDLDLVGRRREQEPLGVDE